MRKVFLLLIIVTMLSGCAIGKKTSYEGRSDFEVTNRGDHDILVAVHDQRPYVQSGNKKPNFTGIQKSFGGIPYNVTTTTGSPLADDFGLMIANTFKYRGITSSYIEVPYTWSFDDFKINVINDNKENDIYYIEMLEWKTEVHFRGALHFNLLLHVFDTKGDEIANNNKKGFLYFDKEQPSQENLATATTDILEKLFAWEVNSKPSESTETPTNQPSEIQKDTQPDTDRVKDDSIFSLVPEDIKMKIKKKCEMDHPNDFALQATCSKKQIEGWKELNK